MPIQNYGDTQMEYSDQDELDAYSRMQAIIDQRLVEMGVVIPSMESHAKEPSHSSEDTTPKAVEQPSKDSSAANDCLARAPPLQPTGEQDGRAGRTRL